MKKLLILLAMACVVVPAADARIVKVAAESNFTTANPPETWKVSLVEDVETKTGQILKAGSIIEGKITDVVQPKRLKRDASFVFVPITAPFLSLTSSVVSSVYSYPIATLSKFLYNSSNDG